MEITKHPLGDVLELRIKGRLDSYWAYHLASGLVLLCQSYQIGVAFEDDSKNDSKQTSSASP